MSSGRQGQGMNASRRFTIAAIALSACMGAVLALVFERAGEAAASLSESRAVDLRVAEELRPSLAEFPEPPDVRRSPLLLPSLRQSASDDADAMHDRFAFVSPEVGTLVMPWETAAVLETPPPSWSTEVKALAAATARNFASLPATVARAVKRTYTLKGRLAEIAPVALQRVQSRFQDAKVQWPPVELAYVAIKDERALEVYAKSMTGAWQFVHRYKVLGASGKTGPKLVRGDKQVPEGVYRISYLNPNSAYHVSMRVSYPNAFDREMAKQDGRKDLGGDIMIHGKNLSAGCLAVGDQNAEELFVLANEVGLKNVSVVIAPTDLRSKAAPALASGPAWTGKLYTEIASAMTPFKAPPPAPSLLSSLFGL